MKQISLQSIMKDAKNGAFIGVGISLTLAIATSNHPTNLLYFLGNIIFGFFVGSLLNVGNKMIVHNIFFRVFSNSQKPITPLLVVVYIASVLFFYSFTWLYNHVYLVIPYGAEIFYVSLGVGVACLMITFFSRYTAEKEEMLRLEKENRKLAVIEERNRIARELHDSVSQNLFGINLHLNTLELIMEKEPEKAKKLVGVLREMGEEVQTEMRLMIYELRPAALSEKGFFEAVESLINLFQVRYSLNIWSDLQGSKDLESQKQLVLYRVLQESLNNIVNHAGATKIKIALHVWNNNAELEIRDNGKGFVVAEIDEDKHLGIKGMKERVGQMKGEFELRTVLGEGTTVRVRI